jgi:predicted small secreted protein
MRRAVILVVAFSVVLSGCAGLRGMFKGSSTPSKVSKAPEVSAILKFDDVPVPDGFRFIANESFAFQTQDVRVGLLKYEGKADPDAIVQFYKEQMPLYNWKVVNIIEYGKRLLNFEKDGQSAVVTIEPRGGKVIITIAVSPRSGGETEILTK